MQRLVLGVPPEFRFRAGQYLEILHPDGVIPLSIASGPARLPRLHLHYRSQPGVDAADWMDELLAGPPELLLRGPCGNVTLPAADDAPLLLVAGGTGIAQILSLLEHLAHGSPRAGPTAVLWCVDQAGDLYCRSELEAIAGDAHVECVVDARRNQDNGGLARLRALTATAARPHTIIAGSPGFVHGAADVLRAAGLDSRNMQSDVFAWAPQPGSGA